MAYRYLNGWVGTVGWMNGPLIGGWIDTSKSNGTYPCSKCMRQFRIVVKSMVTAVSPKKRVVATLEVCCWTNQARNTFADISRF